jgi:hypothetical protein
MTKFLFPVALMLLTFNLLTSCGNTENSAEETTEAIMEEAQQVPSNAQNTLKEKTQSTEVSTYTTSAAMKQALEGLQSEIEGKIKRLQADLNGADEEAAMIINKKINALQEYQQELEAYKGKSDQINEAEAPDFGKNVAFLINKIKRDIATFENEK